MSGTIYFDHNATTPLDPRVREAMRPFLDDCYGNPSSAHQVGQRSRVALDKAREQVAAIWACQPAEIVFTSGGTESNNLALCGVARRLSGRGRHIITSSVEHPAVLECCRFLADGEGFAVTFLPVDPEGRVIPETLASAIRPETILVSIMAANNQTGTIQPVAQLGAICHERGILFHTDAAQWFGKETFENIHQFNADLVTACAHKYYGPKGAGALYVRSGIKLAPLLWGGGQEAKLRPGTENLPGIIGFAEATRHFVKDIGPAQASMRTLTERLASNLNHLEGLVLRGSQTQRLSNTLAFTLADCDSTTLVAALDLKGICVSGGSACSSGSLNPSHVLLAMGLGKTEAQGLVRLSLGWDSTQDEVDRFLEVITILAGRIHSQPPHDPKRFIPLAVLSPADSTDGQNPALEINRGGCNCPQGCAR